MTRERPDRADPDLPGMWSRIPSAAAVPAGRPSGIAALRAGWLPRHTVAMMVLTPALFLAYRSALGSDLDPSWGR